MECRIHRKFLGLDEPREPTVNECGQDEHRQLGQPFEQSGEPVAGEQEQGVDGAEVGVIEEALVD
jgi:hypothetical protein